MNTLKQYFMLTIFAAFLNSCNSQPETTTTVTTEKKQDVDPASLITATVIPTTNTPPPITKSEKVGVELSPPKETATSIKQTTANDSKPIKSTKSESNNLTASVPTTQQSSGVSSGIQSGKGAVVKATNTSGTGPQTPQFPGRTNTPNPNTGNTPNPPTSTGTSDGKGRGGSSSNGTGSPTTNTTPETNTNNGKGRGGNSTGSTNTPNTNTGGGGGVGDVLGDILGGGTGNFTESEAAKAIKEALMKGISTGVDKVSVTDGYFKNGLIKIPFPKDAQVVETTLRQIGMGSMIDNVVLASNRAAESAAKQALPIFVNSITQMTINDAINIVSNKQSDAATQFLQRTTTEPLVAAFKPSIKSALDKTLATKYWADVMGYYNKVPFVQKINTDLTDFVTRKAVSGLFYMIGQEEARIRKDPGARTSDILKKVFGNLKF